MNYLNHIINEQPFSLNDRIEIENICRRVGISDKSKQITLIMPQKMHSNFSKHKFAVIWDTIEELSEAISLFLASGESKQFLHVKSVNSVENVASFILEQNLSLTAFAKRIQAILKPRPKMVMILLQSDAYINHAFKKIKQVHFDFDWNPKIQVKQFLEEDLEQKDFLKQERKNTLENQGTNEGILIESSLDKKQDSYPKQERNSSKIKILSAKQTLDDDGGNECSPPTLIQSQDQSRPQKLQIRQKRPYKKRKPPVHIDSINISISMEKPSNEPSLRSSSSDSVGLPALQRKVVKKRSKNPDSTPKDNSEDVHFLKQHLTNIHQNIATQVQQLEWATTHLFKLLEKVV